MKELILIVTAAGLGTRLKEYSLKKKGKYIDKPLIRLKNKTLLNWSVKPFYPLITNGLLKFSNIYVVIREDQDIEGFKNAINEINNNIKLITIKRLSRGPAHTAFEACQNILNFKDINKKTIIVSDSDHTFRSDSLLNFLRNKNEKNFNAFCTLKSVDKPENWGYIIKKNNNKFISGEKNILEMDISYQKQAEFLIGCYLYNDLLSLKEGIRLFENSIFQEKESYHSIILSLLSQKEPVSTINSDWGIGLGTISQLEEAEQSLISFEGNREPSTYIFDIDGVIFKHDKGSFSESEKFETRPIHIEKNVEYINTLFCRGSYIVIFSSRSENSRDQTTNSLKNIGLNYHKLILGATSGTRYLINDLKPSNLALETAISINTIRDQSIQEDTFYKKFDFIKDCSKGSGAFTTILKDQSSNKAVVRKWTKSKDEDVSKTLYSQFSYINIMSKYIKSFIPEILDWKFNSNEISFYEMSYIEGKNIDLNKIQDNPFLTKNLCEILSILYESSLKNDEKENLNNLVIKIINKKLKPSIQESTKNINNIFKDSKFIKFEFISELIKELDKISLNDSLWKNHNQCLIHGDLTFENILIAKGSMKLIDPLGSTMDIRFNRSMDQLTSPIFDFGKLLQSIISKYESWAYLDQSSIEIYLKNFSIEEEISNIDKSIKSHKIFFSFFNQYVDGNIINDGLFSLAQILIRVCPYRIKSSYTHSGIICLLKAYSILKYLNN